MRNLLLCSQPSSLIHSNGLRSFNLPEQSKFWSNNNKIKRNLFYDFYCRLRQVCCSYQQTSRGIHTVAIKVQLELECHGCRTKTRFSWYLVYIYYICNLLTLCNNFYVIWPMRSATRLIWNLVFIIRSTSGSILYICRIKQMDGKHKTLFHRKRIPRWLKL